MKNQLFVQRVGLSAKLLLITVGLIIFSCSPKDEKVKSGDMEMTLQESQDLYSAEFLNMLNILSEIRAGRAEQLASTIESSIPQYLTQISGFNESAFKTVSFYNASMFYMKQDKTPPAEFEAQIKQAMIDSKTVLSDDCYDLFPTCVAVNCVPWPTSLRPVNINSPNPEGWRYIKNSHCGIAWPKVWRGCGPPINGPACY
jgi:hypothetical protein